MTHTDPRRAIAAAALALAAMTATPVAAQWGFAGGYRSVGGEEADDRNFDRKGFEARVFRDRNFTERFSWRAEFTYTQMQFQRDDGNNRYQVAENGLELAGAARAEIVSGAFSGLSAYAGPVASYRAVCGVSGSVSPTGRVACDAGETFSPGVQLGGGYRWPATEKRDFIVEVRYLNNVVSGAGRSVVAVSVGIRGR